MVDCKSLPCQKYMNIFFSSKSRKSTIEDVIERLYKVPGMTNDAMRLYPKKSSIYVKFKDGSGTLRLFINTLKIHHIYVFDNKNKCLVGGYVGWIHANGLLDEINSIKLVNQ